MRSKSHSPKLAIRSEIETEAELHASLNRNDESFDQHSKRRIANNKGIQTREPTKFDFCIYRLY